MRHVDFRRHRSPEPLVGLVEWFWSVRWDLRIGFVHRQQVLSHPAVNISLGNPPPPGEDPPPGPYAERCVVNGVTTELTTRTLYASGWNLAARTTVGGFGAWVDDVASCNERALPGHQVLPGLDDDLAVRAASLSNDQIVDLLGQRLLTLLEKRPPARIAQARDVAQIASAVEHDRSVTVVADLARLAGVSTRTLQRSFLSCAGLSPTAVIRRYRLVEAAELVRDGAPVDWAEVAARLGYSDQSHLTRDFTATLGQSPARYAAAVRAAVEH
ncbi:MAG TPA: AraC family transcriptional regulator [Candidatus Avipropionibacterium avicola]|uniref:AraC family transcriptional regulator n=1 Tax=Candidatus Avipropionibacterium avicola TaxID=2840701 RepID=A0A9D1KNC1_9ACTN|nr:AraC family transcriptional regulator [Candidatus Avipropionibacterium avicola]